MAFFTTSLVASGIQMAGFASIANIMKKCYNDVNDVEISMLVLVFIIFFIPLLFPANKL